MRQATVWVIYLGVVMAGGALLAPWFYWGAQEAAQHGAVFENVAAEPFHRYVHRAMLLLAFIGLFFLLRTLGLKGWRGVGLPSPAQHLRPLGAGVLLGLVSLSVLGVLLFLVGAAGPDSRRELSEQIAKVGRTLLTAVGVGFLEELLFRGTLFGALRKAISWKGALIVSSAVYALLHFLQKPAPPPTVNWNTGLDVLGGMFEGLWPPSRFGAELVCLLLGGLILGLAYQRTGTLYFSIGLHAAWILWARTFNLFTAPRASEYRWLWGTGRLYDGWLAALVLGVLLVWMWNSQGWYKSKALPRAVENDLVTLEKTEREL